MSLHFCHNSLSLLADLMVCLLQDYYNSGGNSPSFRDDTNRKGYDEYDAGEYDEAPAVRRSNSLRTASSPLSSRRLGATSSSSQPSRLPEAKAKEKEKEKPVPVDDLLGDWGNDSGVATSSTTISSNNKALPALVPPTTTDGMNTVVVRNRAHDM